jgi:hypothetical protein
MITKQALRNIVGLGLKSNELRIKGIVSRDGLSTETIGVYSSLGLNNPPHICLTPRKSRVKNL